MRIRVKLVGFPALRDRLGRDPADVELAGATLADLLRWLQRNHGDPAQTRLLNAAGQLDPDIVVFRNGRHPMHPDAELVEGDQLTLVLVLAGG